MPDTYREASLALGASKSQTIARVVLPCALPGMLTGAILGVACAAGRDRGDHVHRRGLLYTKSPDSLFSAVMALPYHMYVLATAGTDIEKHPAPAIRHRTCAGVAGAGHEPGSRDPSRSPAAAALTLVNPEHGEMLLPAALKNAAISRRRCPWELCAHLRHKRGWKRPANDDRQTGLQSPDGESAGNGAWARSRCAKIIAVGRPSGLRLWTKAGWA